MSSLFTEVHLLDTLWIINPPFWAKCEKPLNCVCGYVYSDTTARIRREMNEKFCITRPLSWAWACCCVRGGVGVQTKGSWVIRGEQQQQASLWMRTQSSVTRPRPLSISRARGMKAGRLSASRECLIGICAASIRTRTGKKSMWNGIGRPELRNNYSTLQSVNGNFYSDVLKLNIYKRTPPATAAEIIALWQQVALGFVCFFSFNLLRWNNYTIMLSSVNTISMRLATVH